MISMLRDVLQVYDERFLDLGTDDRRRLVQGTRQLLGDGLPAEARAELPVSVRLRAFCIQRELYDELDRLIRDEMAGHQAGAVVVGGRVYALYPYLRGVPRHDADITDEVVAEHHLEDLSWSKGALRVRGSAAISQVEAREFTVALVLRQGAAEHRIPAIPHDGGFEAVVEAPEGRWTVHISVSAHGVTREAPFGANRGEKIKTLERDGLRADFDGAGTLTLSVPGEIRRGRLRRLLRVSR